MMGAIGALLGLRVAPRGAARRTGVRRRDHGDPPRAPRPPARDARERRHDGGGRALSGDRSSRCACRPRSRVRSRFPTACRSGSGRWRCWRCRGASACDDASGTIADERGQALVEMGIVVVLLVTLVMGTIEFGRAWMIVNMITHAARDGARIGGGRGEPDAGGAITNTSAIQTQVLDRDRERHAHDGLHRERHAAHHRRHPDGAGPGDWHGALSVQPRRHELHGRPNGHLPRRGALTAPTTVRDEESVK